MRKLRLQRNRDKTNNQVSKLPSSGSLSEEGEGPTAWQELGIFLVEGRGKVPSFSLGNSSNVTWTNCPSCGVSQCWLPGQASIQLVVDHTQKTLPLWALFSLSVKWGHSNPYFLGEVPGQHTVGSSKPWLCD
jgi:hypothetical protein